MSSLGRVHLRPRMRERRQPGAIRESRPAFWIKHAAKTINYETSEEKMASTASRLRSDLTCLTQKLVDLVQELPVKRLERFGAGIAIIAPEYYWDELSDEQLNAQLAIKRDYEEWYEVFRSIFANATVNLNKRTKEADKSFRKWVELRSNWSLQPDPKSNEKELRDDANLFMDLLAVIEAGGTMAQVLIPDTNAIADNPDPTQYRAISENDRFTFLLLPTVLAELDSLKNTHRNPAFREKVNKAITRIKGWRRQGQLLNGVTVDKTITVRAVAKEPDMSNTLSWLDKENRDDRIIASVLEVQSSYPNAEVVLISGDINLSNKADLARIETDELIID